MNGLVAKEKTLRVTESVHFKVQLAEIQVILGMLNLFCRTGVRNFVYRLTACWICFVYIVGKADTFVSMQLYKEVQM